MSITSVGAASSFTSNALNPFQQRRQDFQALKQALSSGDLSGAQSAFSALQQLVQTQSGGTTGAAGAANSPAPGVSATSGTSSPLASDWTALSTALTSGDLKGAQTAFSQLQSDFRASFQSAAGSSGLNLQGASTSGGPRVHHGGHHHQSGGTSGSGATTQSSTTSGTADSDGDNDGSAASTSGSLLNVTA